jgi:hypothetical protein
MYGNTSHVATGTGLTALAYTGLNVGHWMLLGVTLIFAGVLLQRIVKRGRRKGTE